jgi:hypothetical protein
MNYMKITDVSSLLNINIVNLTNFINIIDVSLLGKIFNWMQLFV